MTDDSTLNGTQRENAYTTTSGRRRLRRSRFVSFAFSWRSLRRQAIARVRPQARSLQDVVACGLPTAEQKWVAFVKEKGGLPQVADESVAKRCSRRLSTCAGWLQLPIEKVEILKCSSELEMLLHQIKEAESREALNKATDDVEQKKACLLQFMTCVKTAVKDVHLAKSSFQPLDCLPISVHELSVPRGREID